MTSGERLHEAMKERGFSMKRLARESGLDYKTIKRMVSGDCIGYVDTWVRACDAMGVSLSDVLQGVRERRTPDGTY